MNTNTFPAFERSEIQDTQTLQHLKHLKHLKHLNLLLLAALAIVLTQCKKPILQSLNGGGTVSITLSVDGNSKLTVTPDETAATVEFTSGDAIYVASDGKYVGTLYHDGTNFKGDITGATEGQKLYFYFLGNKDATDESGAALTTTGTPSTSLMVNISDQSASLPVISYAPSTENYSSGVTSYKAVLDNQCGLVKFTTSDYTGSGDLSVRYVKNIVSIGLGDQTITLSDGGNTKLMRIADGGNCYYYGILMPGEPDVTSGVAFSSDNYIGTYSMSAVSANCYITSGAITLAESEHNFFDLGLPSGLLWATCNVGASSPEGYGGYFSWGETTAYNQVPSAYPSGWTGSTNDGYKNLVTNNTAKTDYSWTYYKWGTSTSSLFKYTGSDTYGTTLESSDDAATANWGGSWRMPTKAEFLELYNTSNTTWTWTTDYNSKGVSGYVVTGKKEDYTDKSIFLPAAGSRNGTSLYDAGSRGGYWSSSLYSSSPYHACRMDFYSGNVSTQGRNYRYFGYTVRPVQ